MSNYYLIARDKKTNDYQVLKLNDEWYLDEKRATGHVFRANDLEAIDLVTSCFQNREDLAARLYENGYIVDPHVDIVIASLKKKNGRHYVKFEEPIYNSGNKSRTNSLRKIAANSLNGNMFADKEATGIVYDDIIARSYFCDDLFSMIMDGETNIPKRFAELLSKIPSYEETPYDLKYDRGFGFNNYLEARSVVEMLDRFENFGAGSHDNRVDMNEDFIDENYTERLELVPRLSLELDKDFCEGQLSLFSFFDDKDSERVKAATKMVAREAKPQRKGRTSLVQPQKPDVPVNEMPREIFRVLETLPSNLFKRDEDNKWQFNENVFSYPILDDERAKLNNLLTGNMPKFFMNYAMHKRQMIEAQNYGEYSEASELGEYCERDKNAIRTRFKSHKCIMDTYRWCMLYEGCMKRDAAYAASGISVGSESADAKIFGKRQ